MNGPTSASTLRIAVFGTGGVGGYFRGRGRLAKAGVDVTFIARGEHLRAIRKTGLKVDSIVEIRHAEFTPSI